MNNLQQRKAFWKSVYMRFQNFTRIAMGQLSVKGCLSVAGL